MEKKQVKVSSLKKAILVLNCFTEKQKLGVTEISNLLELNKSNVHNILSTFEMMDYLEKDEESGKYQLGFGIFNLSRALGDSFSISKIASPYMQELANSMNERVYLGIPNDDEVVYLEALYPVGEIGLMRSILGKRAKMYCTGIGKAMMAYLPEEEIIKYSKRELQAFTDTTITSQERLLIELEEIRKRGYSIDNMEHEFGVKCVALPIFDKNNTMVAAISVSGPSLRFNNKRIINIAEKMKVCAKQIETKI